MSDPIARNLQRLNQAKYNYDASLLRSSGLQNPSFNEGFDLNKGKLRINTIGEGVSFAAPISTGGIAIGDRVIRKGGFADSTTFVETTQQAVARKSVPSIQVAFTWEGGVYIGGDRPEPRQIYTLQPGEAVESITFNNEGRGKFFAGLQIATGSANKCLSINERGVFYEFQSGDREIGHIGRFYWAETWGVGTVSRFFPVNDVDTGGSAPDNYSWNPLVVSGDVVLPSNTATRSVNSINSNASATIPTYILPGIERISTYNRSESSTTFDYTIPLIVGRGIRSVVYAKYSQNPTLTIRWFYYDADADIEVEILNGLDVQFPPIDSPNPLIGQGNLIRGIYSPYLVASQEDLRIKKKIPVTVWDLRGDDGSQINAGSRTINTSYFPIRSDRFPDAFLYWTSFHPG